MAQVDSNKKYLYIRWFLLRLALVVYDILVVNFAYFLALLVRFYVNFEFNIWGARYIPAFMQFAPFYTVASLIVFSVAGLYKSQWKYASLNDMNRILISSVVTCVIHIVGTLVFVMRMPITYYALGAAFQFVLIAISRFSYRLILIEKSRFFKRRKPGTVNVLVVGEGESSRTVIKHLERDENSMAHPVCVIDFHDRELSGTMAGIPVMGGIEKIRQAVKEYNAERVILADTLMPAEIRQEVREICREIRVESQDFSSCFQRVPGRIPLSVLMEYTDGPVEILLEEGVSLRKLETAEAMRATEKYIVSSLNAENGVLTVRVVRDLLQPNDIKEDWVQSFRSETGEDISFF